MSASRRGTGQGVAPGGGGITRTTRPSASTTVTGPHTTSLPRSKTVGSFPRRIGGGGILGSGDWRVVLGAGDAVPRVGQDAAFAVDAVDMHPYHVVVHGADVPCDAAAMDSAVEIDVLELRVYENVRPLLSRLLQVRTDGAGDTGREPAVTVVDSLALTVTCGMGPQASGGCGPSHAATTARRPGGPNPCGKRSSSVPCGSRSPWARRRRGGVAEAIGAVPPTVQAPLSESLPRRPA